LRLSETFLTAFEDRQPHYIETQYRKWLI